MRNRMRVMKKLLFHSFSLSFLALETFLALENLHWTTSWAMSTRRVVDKISFHSFSLSFLALRTFFTHSRSHFSLWKIYTGLLRGPDQHDVQWIKALFCWRKKGVFFRCLALEQAQSRCNKKKHRLRQCFYQSELYWTRTSDFHPVKVTL